MAKRPTGLPLYQEHATGDVPYDDLWSLLWDNIDQGRSADAFRAMLQHSDAYAKLTPERKALLDIAVTVLDKNVPLDTRLKAAMTVSEAPDNHNGDAEGFLNKMFQGFTRDGNIANDADKIKAVERALNGMKVGNTVLQVAENGIADDRLAVLLRQPEVVQALHRAQQAGTLHDVKFQENFNFDPQAIRLLNTHDEKPPVAHR